MLVIILENMKILIIENNNKTRNQLKSFLRKSYSVDVVDNGRDGISQARAAGYDAIILDLNLPDIDGSEVCSTLRDEGLTVPILVLTSNTDPESKVTMLDMGADDYITKPFNFDELQARIRVALRRGQSLGCNNKLFFQSLELDPVARTVSCSGIEITLRRKEFDLLEYLMRNPGQTLTRSMILGNIWDSNEDLWANVVDVHVKHLRDKIDKPFGTKMIQTVHGLGYKLYSAREVLTAKP